jgi:dienelactone hydrolase
LRALARQAHQECGGHGVGAIGMCFTGNFAPFFAHRAPFSHSVVTQHLIDEAGYPTIAARNEILAFFAKRLAAVIGTA